MEKRFLLAIGLSFLVLMAYSALVPNTQPIVNKCVINESRIQPPNVYEEINTQAPWQKTILDYHNLIKDNKLYVIETADLVLKFSKKGGFLLEATDKVHQSNIPIRNIGLVKEWADYDFEITGSADSVVFTYSDNKGSVIKKTFSLKSNKAIDLSIVLNNATSSISSSYSILVGYFNPAETNNPLLQRYYESAVFVNDTISRKPTTAIKNAVSYDGKILWAALRDRYFCSIVVPQLTVNKSVIEKLEKGYISFLEISRQDKPVGVPIEDKFSLYIGPQDELKLKALGSSTTQLIYFGKFDSISKFLLFLLKTSQKVTHSLGVSIIIVSILIYVVFFPVSFKSMISMRKMQALQPKIEELKVKHKDNPQKMNVELMELYRREKVNPLGGCLPMLLQIPVFFALYQLLMRLISLKCTSFLWIKDLSEPDRLAIFKNHLPVIGNELNILPLLMGGVMFLQQKLTMPKADTTSQAAEQQKIMAIVMPILFGVLFYKMPSGLVIYWFTNSLLMFAFQWKISKISP